MTTDLRHCLWCGSILGIDKGEAEPDYDGQHCSEGCYLLNNRTDSNCWLFWLPNEIPLARCVPVLSHHDLDDCIITETLYDGSVMVTDGRQLWHSDGDGFHVDMTEPAGFAHVLRWVAAKRVVHAQLIPDMSMWYLMRWTIAARDGTVTDDDRLELARLAWVLSDEGQQAKAKDAEARAAR